MTIAREDRVEIDVPSLRTFRDGNTGIPYVWSFDAEAPGPHVVLNALMHGNELSGAWALKTLLEHGIRPSRGRLTFTFANIAAFERFDPAQPRASRFVEEDMNRLWHPPRLDSPAVTVEQRRARELLPVLTSADLLLDLHSMQTPSPPLVLCGLREKGRRLAAAIGYPEYVVADAGHANGVRLIDHAHFADPEASPVAVLLEAGQHWARATIDVALATALMFLRATGAVDADALARVAPLPPPAPQRFVEVTEAVMVRHESFAFVRRFDGLEVIRRAGEVIAHDGDEPVVTPYEDCVLIMPSRRLTPGLTAVRLGRFVPPPSAAGAV